MLCTPEERQQDTQHLGCDAHCGTVIEAAQLHAVELLMVLEALQWLHSC